MTTIHAPDLPVDAEWLNVERPLTRDDLRGRVVVLDFFTYACINCLLTLPVLAEAERDLAGEPVVFVGVHSPKFPTEGDAGLVREALRRHGVTHPVVVDTAHRVWSEYAVTSWPTLVFLRPDGTIFGQASGEPEREPLVATIRAALAEQPGRLVHDPLPLRPEPALPGVLAYPGGLAVGPGALYVADTDHHQVVTCAPDGTERGRYGSGAPGLRDGAAGEARFLHPHGLAVAPDDALIVADTGNHAIRRIDLGTGEVVTLAGTGRRGTSLAGSGLALRTDLRAPWDVAVHPLGSPLVAMAGSHQLWAIDQGIAAVFAGSGREARVDGAVATAAFAQPSGLAWGPDGGLYVADSETSAIRRVGGGQVTTLAGGDLFDFGDADGIGDDVRLQHPVGIAAAEGGSLDGLMLIADTLNHKVRILDPATREVRTLFGDGTPFDAPLAALERHPAVPADARSAAFCREPEAVAYDGSRVLLADTDNHRVLAADPSTGAVSVLLGG